MNCEDIAMNFLISNLTGKAPIKVTPRKRFKCAQCSSNDSLWSESSHFVKRSECLSVFERHFGRMPLRPVEFRVDPVLFQENVPQDEKAYPNVGMVWIDGPKNQRSALSTALLLTLKISLLGDFFFLKSLSEVDILVKLAYPTYSRCTAFRKILLSWYLHLDLPSYTYYLVSIF